MPEPDPDQTPTITVPASATAPPRPAEPTEAPPASNGSSAMSTLPPQPPESRPAEERVVPPPAPTSTVLPRTAPATTAPPPGPSRSRSVAAVGSRFVVIHPHVSFFSWLADKQGPADATPEERLERYRRDSPWLFRACVALDLLVLFVVTAILVGALAAVLFKAVFGVV
jgi:hypothetical protein